VESLGGNINAGTSKDFTYYHVEIAYPYWREALEVLYQLTMKALLKEEFLEKEKSIVIEELRRSKDNPTTVLWETFEKTAYKVSPYRFPVIGFEETVRKFTSDMVRNFYRNFYQPRNMALVIVGRVDPAEVEEVVAETFGRDPNRYEEVRKKVFDILRKTYETLTDEMVESAKERIINGRIFEEEKVESEAYDIGYSYTVAKDLNFYRYFEKNIRRVRRVDVLRIFERYLREDSYVEGVK